MKSEEEDGRRERRIKTMTTMKINRGGREIQKIGNAAESGGWL